MQYSFYPINYYSVHLLQQTNKKLTKEEQKKMKTIFCIKAIIYPNQNGPENICFINKPNYYYFYYEGYFSFIKMQRSTLLTFKMQHINLFKVLLLAF